MRRTDGHDAMDEPLSSNCSMYLHQCINYWKSHWCNYGKGYESRIAEAEKILKERKKNNK